MILLYFEIFFVTYYQRIHNILWWRSKQFVFPIYELRKCRPKIVGILTECVVSYKKEWYTCKIYSSLSVVQPFTTYIPLTWNGKGNTDITICKDLNDKCCQEAHCPVMGGPEEVMDLWKWEGLGVLLAMDGAQEVVITTLRIPPVQTGDYIIHEIVRKWWYYFSTSASTWLFLPTYQLYELMYEILALTICVCVTNWMSEFRIL